VSDRWEIKARSADVVRILGKRKPGKCTAMQDGLQESSCCCSEKHFDSETKSGIGQISVRAKSNLDCIRLDL